MKIPASAAKEMTPHYESSAPIDDLAVVMKLPDGDFLRDGVPCIPANLKGDLVPSPFMDPRLRQLTTMVRDLSSSFVRESPGVTFESLLARVVADNQVTDVVEDSIRSEFVEECLRMLVANKGFKVQLKAGRHELELGPDFKIREKERTFAASLAEELGALSDRMAAIVPHAGEQGRFREDLFRSVLERNLPTRYHVATGFIEGCSRQLDILIYDQIDYAPVFREAGVVVVPPEAVRAVIEVKTTLNAAELEDALDKLADVCSADDCKPPFFKGVFAYRGPVKEKTVTNYILNYYRREPGITTGAAPSAGDAPDPEAPKSDSKDVGELRDEMIKGPFQHLTALCVDRSYFAEVLPLRVSPTDSFISPTVCVRGSKTNLTPQTALFVEALGEHLNLHTIKRREPQPFSRKLGHDLETIDRQAIYTDLWGPYFDVMGGRDEKSITREIRAQAIRVARWRRGKDWFSTL